MRVENAGCALELKIHFKNRWMIVSPIESDGRSQVEIFMDDVSSNFQSNISGLMVMMERHSKHGCETFNTEQCHYVDQSEKIYEYIKGRLRFFWFEDEDRVIVCTHGIVKKSQKTPKREIDKALRVKTAYLLSKSSRSLQFIDEA